MRYLILVLTMLLGCYSKPVEAPKPLPSLNVKPHGFQWREQSDAIMESKLKHKPLMILISDVDNCNKIEKMMLEDEAISWMLREKVLPIRIISDEFDVPIFIFTDTNITPVVIYTGMPTMFNLYKALYAATKFQTEEDQYRFDESNVTTDRGVNKTVRFKTFD